jgi:hypothetical protein
MFPKKEDAMHYHTKRGLAENTRKQIEILNDLLEQCAEAGISYKLGTTPICKTLPYITMGLDKLEVRVNYP